MTWAQLLMTGGAVLFAFLCGAWFGSWVADAEDEEFEAEAFMEASKNRI